MEPPQLPAVTQDGALLRHQKKWRLRQKRFEMKTFFSPVQKWFEKRPKYWTNIAQIQLMCKFQLKGLWL